MKKEVDKPRDSITTASRKASIPREQETQALFLLGFEGKFRPNLLREINSRLSENGLYFGHIRGKIHSDTLVLNHRDMD